MKKKFLILMMVMATTITTLFMLPSKGASALEELGYTILSPEEAKDITFPVRECSSSRTFIVRNHTDNSNLSISEGSEKYGYDGDLSNYVWFDITSAMYQKNVEISYDLTDGVFKEIINTIIVKTDTEGADCLYGFYLYIDDVLVATISDYEEHVRNCVIKLDKPIEAERIMIRGMINITNWIKLYEFNATYYDYGDTDENNCVVSFNSNGGTPLEEVNIPRGSYLYLPNPPQREGYTFAGWYSDKELTTEVLTGTQVDSDLVLYAKWIINNNPDDDPFDDFPNDNFEEPVEDDENLFEKLFTKDNLISLICLVAIVSFVASLFSRRR